MSVVNSTYLDKVSEYSTSTQEIRRGVFIGSYDYRDAPTGDVTERSIVTSIKNMISNGNIPQNDGDTYYAIHGAPGVIVSKSQTNEKSCTFGGYCGFHGTATNEDKYLIYGYIPSFSNTICRSECGQSTLEMNNWMGVSSHELVASITNPAVGVATSFSSPLSWYDSENGEINDVCDKRMVLIECGDGKRFPVQMFYSMKLGKCIA